MGFGSELWDNFGACVDRTEEGLQALKIAEEFFRKVRGKQSCILLGGGLGGSGWPVGGYFYFVLCDVGAVERSNSLVSAVSCGARGVVLSAGLGCGNDWCAFF